MRREWLGFVNPGRAVRCGENGSDLLTRAEQRCGVEQHCGAELTLLPPGLTDPAGMARICQSEPSNAVSEPSTTLWSRADAATFLRFTFQTSSIQHQTSSIKHPTSNIQHPTSNIISHTSPISPSHPSLIFS